MKYFHRYIQVILIVIMLLASLQTYAEREDSIRVLFTWAEANHSELFAPSPATIQRLDPWIYTYYPQTNTYAGVNNEDEVWVLGDVFGGMLYINTLSILLNTIGYEESENSNPTDTNTNFKLFPDNYFTSYDVSASLTGSDNKGNSYTGSIVEKTLIATTFLGENTIPIETKTEFTVSNGGFAVATLNNHYSMNANDRRFLGVSGDVVTASATTNSIPQAAKIGDSGSVGVYIDSAGFESILTWKLENGFNGNAKLVYFNTTNNQSGDLDNTFTTTYLIKSDGTRLSVELITYNDNVNLEATLKGDY